MKHYVGERVRVGGSRGCIMTITDIDGDEMILKDGNSTFYYHNGDCALIHYKEFEQLCLF